eukprot:GHRQ01037478.1.p2 GENE.GHRQ01037478.1~~GHRQ01037478.1.p2  ORF type:complete len:114 (-),score=37.54 GHRQ01037478.1:346-687(-)
MPSTPVTAVMACLLTLHCVVLHAVAAAGKSSLLNAICGEERAIVCDMSGTTRDAVDTTVTLPGGQQLTLIDTAGIRKRARVADSKCAFHLSAGKLQTVWMGRVCQAGCWMPEL